MAPIQGTVAEGFAAVADAFEENFAGRGEFGAAFCASVAGRRVADLWGGEARPGTPWECDTPVVVFSTTKGATALVVQALAEQGAIDVDTPVAAYWPEFAARGKAEITLRQVLTHTSGVVDFPRYTEVVDDLAWWLDPDRIAADFARADPAWDPGSAHGYHGASFGLLLGEVVRRATGATLGSHFRRLVADPLGLDFWIGLPREHADGVAFLKDAPAPEDPVLAAYLSLFTPETLTGRAHLIGKSGVFDLADGFNEPGFWEAEFPSGGGIATARGVAGMYEVLARGGNSNGVAVVSEESIAAHSAQQVAGPDLVLLFETRFGLGYQRPTEFVEFGPNDAAFGHGGMGGSLGFADPDREVAVGYVMNQMRFPAPGETTRARALVDALYSCLP
jgi:CubicO group peptidase (beta-lactamase class C family)